MQTYSNASIEKIYSFLGKVRLKNILLHLITGIMAFFSAIAGIVFIFSSVIILYPFSYAGILFTSLLTVLLPYVFVKYIILPLNASSIESLAISLERSNSFINNDLINALHLNNFQSPYRHLFSQPLIGALTKKTSGILKQLDISKLLPLSLFKKQVIGFVALATLLGGLSRFKPTVIPEAVTAILHPVIYYKTFSKLEQKKNIVKDIALPQVGDIELKYTYPAYTGLASFNISASSGDVKALRGTQVNITAKVSKDIEQAVLKLEPNMSSPMEILSGRNIKGQFVVMEEGIYTLSVTDKTGQINDDKSVHSISVIEDDFPSIEILFPEDSIEVKMLDKVEMQYRFIDDYGISKIGLIYEIFDRNGYLLKKGSLKLPEMNKKRGAGKYLWNLALLKLDEGGSIKYHFEVYDNDTISGPKRGQSTDYQLNIYNFEEGHNEVIFTQEKILEEMILLLAEKLEAPFTIYRIRSSFESEKKEDQHLREILEMIDELVLALKEDEMAHPTTSLAYQKIKERLAKVNFEKKEQLDWLMNNIERTIDRKIFQFINELREKEIAEIESDIIEMDSLIKLEKMNSLQLREEDLMDVQDSLYDLISNLQDMDKDEALKKFKEAIKKIEELMKEFMEKLSSMSKELPDEFVNSEAFKNMDQKEVGDTMQKIKDALKEGDLDMAQKLAKDFMSQMENMINGLMDQAEELAMDGIIPDMEQMDEAVNTAEELLNKEKGLLEQTEKMDAELTKKFDEIYKDLMESLKEKIQNLSAILRNNMRDMKNASNKNIAFQNMTYRKLEKVEDEMRAMLKSFDSDLARAKSHSENMKDRLFELKNRLNSLKRGRMDVSNIINKTDEALKTSEAIVSEFNRFLSNKGSMSKEDLQKMMQMAKQQESIESAAKSFQGALQNMPGTERFLGSEFFKNMQEALRGMNKAGHGLKGGSIQKSLEGERDSINNLSKVSEGLKGFQQALKRMMKNGKGGFRYGMRSFPSSRMGGGRRIRGKVDIPSDEDFKVPGKMRDDILKAMQGGAPKKYKGMNKEYYNELVK